MRPALLKKAGPRNASLVFVSREINRAVSAAAIGLALQFAIGNWGKTAKAARTSVAVILRFYRELASFLALPDLNMRLVELRFDVFASPAQQVAKLLTRKYAQCDSIIKSADIKVD